MRVLYMLMQFPALSETFVLDEIAALIDLGHEITIAAFKKPPERIIHPKIKKYCLMKRTHYLPYANRERENLRVFHRGGPRTDEMIGVLSAVVKIVKKNNIEHIHCHFGDINTAIASLIHKLTGLPYTLTMHGYDIFFKPHPNLAEWVGFAKRIVTVSDYNRKYLVRRAGFARNKVQVIPCGIDLSLFKPFPQEREDLFTILTVARLVAVKGLAYFLTALKLLLDQGIDFQCWIIGEGDQRKNIKKRILESRLGRNVLLLGAKKNDELPAYYNKADLFVLPSISEGSPTVLKESLACGIPVIATNVRGVFEIVRNNENGFLIDSKQPKKIAEKIKELMRDRPLLERFKRNARNVVEQKFDVKKSTKALEKLFLSKK